MFRPVERTGKRSQRSAYIVRISQRINEIGTLGAPMELTQYLGSLKSLMRDVLNEEEVWITCHSVMRLTS